MDSKLRDEMIAKARENGERHGKVAELDFGAGAEWMHEKLAKNQREQLIAFIRWNNKHNGIAEPINEKMADNYLNNIK